MKKYICIFIATICLLTYIPTYAAYTDIVMTSYSYFGIGGPSPNISNTLLTEDGSVWFEKNWNGSVTPPDVTTHMKFPWFYKHPELKDIVSISEHGYVIDKNGDVWHCPMQYGKEVKKTKLSNAKKLVYMPNYSVVLKNDATVWAYNFNKEDEFALLYTHKITENAKDVVRYNSGIMVLKNDGTLHAYSPTVINPTAPSSSMEDCELIQSDKFPMNDIVSVFGSTYHAIACGADGKVYAIGGNDKNCGSSATSDKIFLMPITNITYALPTVFSTYFLKDDKTAWFVGYPEQSDFKGINHPDNEYYPMPTKVPIENVKFVWEGGFIKEDNTFWVMGREAPFYNADGTTTSKVHPTGIEVACLTDKDANETPEAYFPESMDMKGIRDKSYGSDIYFEISNPYSFPLSGMYLYPMKVNGDRYFTEVIVLRYNIPAYGTQRIVAKTETKWAKLDWDSFHMRTPGAGDVDFLAEIQSALDELLVAFYRKEAALGIPCQSFMLDTQYLSEDELYEINESFYRNYNIVLGEAND